MEILNGVLLLGLLFITFRTFRLHAPKCPRCDTPPPLVRTPKNLTQLLGGWTCAECGYELDKWGEPVAQQPFPAKWSVQMDDAPPADDRIKRRSNDIERKGDSHE